MTDSVLVVGAGPTGLALACGLASAGVDVRIVDKATGPSITSRALGLQPRGVEVLDRCGALGDLEQRSNPIRRVLLDVGAAHSVRLEMGRASRLVTRPGLIISQAEVERSLRERLGALGPRVEWGHAVSGLTQSVTGVLVTLDDGEVAGFGWIVGCDGAHSAVRKLVGIEFPGVPLIERFLLADVRADLAASREAASVWLRGDELLAAFPLPASNRWRLMATAPATVTGLPSESTLIEAVTARLQARTGWPPSVVRSVDWTSTFTIQRRLATTYRVGRVLVAGDAAHIHSPFGGQGMNTGLGDAENLAWKLTLVLDGGADPALLDTYQAERRPVAADVLAATSGLTRVILGDSAVSRLIRDRVFGPSLNLRPVQRLIADRASQLRLNYRRGPLGEPDRRRPLFGSRPGDRVPDLACRRPDGGTVRLHAELRRGWALLLPVDDRTGGQARRCAETAIARLGHHRLAILSSAQVHDVELVRPDAHLGWRGTSPAALDCWFDESLHLARAPGPFTPERGGLSSRRRFTVSGKAVGLRHDLHSVSVRSGVFARRHKVT